LDYDVLTIFVSNKRFDKKRGGYEMEIRILGPGCPRCREVEKRTINVMADLNVGADVQKVTDIKKISAYKVFASPAFVINGKVKASGRIPSAEEIKNWIHEEM
jgi:small redox-active disulfide protein 2